MTSSRISRVEAVSAPDRFQRRVVVLLRVGERDDTFRITTDTNLDTGDFETEVRLTWSGTSHNDLAYAEAFHASLGEALSVSRDMNMMIANPGDWRGDGQTMPEHDLDGLPDYLLALYAACKGVSFAYMRGREIEPGMSERVVDLDGLRARAREVAKAVA